MQLISGALHWWTQVEMVILCLRGRSKYVAVVQEEVDHLVELGPAIEELVGVEAGDRAAGDVAHGVAAAAERGQPDALHLLEHLGESL